MDSLLGQTCPNLEILVVDDHSTDGTAGIIDRHARGDARVVQLVPTLLACLQPLGAVLGLLIFCNALRLQWTRSARWKGRALTASRPL